jgi:hypothetical protein
MEPSTIYHIRVKGHLDPHWADWFEGLAITHQENGVSLLAGPVIDQAALHGLLVKIYSLNLTLISLHQVESSQPSPPDMATTS